MVKLPEGRLEGRPEGRPENSEDRWNGLAVVALLVLVMALGFYMTARTFEARYEATAQRIDAADARSKVLIDRVKELKHTLADMEARATQLSNPGLPGSPQGAVQSPSGQWIAPPQGGPGPQGSWRPGAPSYPNPGAPRPPAMAGAGSPPGGSQPPIPQGDAPPGSARGWVPAPPGMPTGGPPAGAYPTGAPPTGGPPPGAYPTGRSAMGMPPGGYPPPGTSP